MTLLDQLEARLATSAFTTSRGPIAGLAIADPTQHWTVLAVEHHRGNEHAVILIAPICDERAASADRVLRLAAEMGAGALAIVSGSYVARFAIPATQLGGAPIEFIATYLHDVARTVGDALAANRADVSSFEHLAA